MDYAEIDRAALAGFESYSTGVKMPRWVVCDELLVSAWRCGHRQAVDKAAIQLKVA